MLIGEPMVVAYMMGMEKQIQVQVGRDDNIRIQY